MDTSDIALALTDMDTMEDLMNLSPKESKEIAFGDCKKNFIHYKVSELIYL